MGRYNLEDLTPDEKRELFVKNSKVLDSIREGEIEHFEMLFGYDIKYLVTNPEIVLQFLSDPVDVHRIAAIRFLTSSYWHPIFSHEKTVSMIMAMAQSDLSMYVRAAAITQLGAINDESADKAIIKFLVAVIFNETEQAYVRQSANVAIHSTDPPSLSDIGSECRFNVLTDVYMCLIDELLSDGENGSDTALQF